MSFWKFQHTQKTREKVIKTISHAWSGSAKKLTFRLSLSPLYTISVLSWPRRGSCHTLLAEGVHFNLWRYLLEFPKVWSMDPKGVPSRADCSGNWEIKSTSTHFGKRPKFLIYECAVYHSMHVTMWQEMYILKQQKIHL